MSARDVLTVLDGLAAVCGWERDSAANNDNEPAAESWSRRHDEASAIRVDVSYLIEANNALLLAFPAHACHRNAKEREAYKAIRAALARMQGDSP